VLGMPVGDAGARRWAARPWLRPWLRSLWLGAALAACAELRPQTAPTPSAARPSAAPGPNEPREQILDDFEQAALWQAEGSDDVSASRSEVVGTDRRGLSLSFDFRGHGGYAALRRALPLTLPENYEISFDLRGDAPVNDFQFKLTDASGENVWWFRKSDFAFPNGWQHITIKKRQIEFAWGPTKERTLARAATLEFVVSAGREGGRGTIAVDGLRLRALPAPLPPPAPIATASSSAPGGEPVLALDGKRETAWRSARDADKAQVFALDLGVLREFGGLLLRWQPEAAAVDYDVELSRDGVSFQRAGSVRGSNGGLDAVLLPEAEARFLRLRLLRAAGDSYALAEIELKELAFGASTNAFVRALAHEAPRGRYPRGFSGEQPYWTIVGADGSPESGLLSEDGALEVGAGGFSIEPFVVVDDQLTSWADVGIDHTLPEGYLPAPSVRWQHDAYELEVSAFATSKPATGTELWARYTLKNRRALPLSLKLVLAVRPYQVNPATQFLNIAGGVSPIRELSWDGAALSVNAGPRLSPLVAPEHVAFASFDAGGFPEGPPPTRGRSAVQLSDASGLASGALVYQLRLQPGQSIALGLVAPLGARTADRVARTGGTMAELATRRAETLATWREQLGRVAIRVPHTAQPVVDSLRSALAHILMSRAGPVLRPGTRSYARSWIRDGAMMAESLLRLGHEDIARAYLSWFAPYQFENGKVPCCVDRRGADPVVENDSAGEFIFLVAELFRFTGDRALLETMWPHVEAAASYLEKLRLSERTAENLTPARRAFYGLMPPSISHEGYSDKPAFSYWDDFWALIGYEDAAALATARGASEVSERLGRARDEFRGDLMASLRASAAQHGVPYLPGSADRGDFDATSTTIALSPGRTQNALPRDQLLATFERYFQEFQARRDDTKVWNDYTPYELRVVSSFVRLGARERAQQLLAFFFRDQRPQGWNQWAEVVGREPREPRFIGDMPHAWIASDYIRSALDLFAYARPAEQQLVLAGGVPLSWFAQSGVAVERLRTPYGALSYTARQKGKSLVFEVKSAAPPGGFAIPWPGEGEPPRALINGKEVTWQGNELRFSTSPARVVLEQPAGEARGRTED
jgi:F5/8 type C domain